MRAHTVLLTCNIVQILTALGTVAVSEHNCVTTQLIQHYVSDRSAMSKHELLHTQASFVKSLSTGSVYMSEIVQM